MRISALPALVTAALATVLLAPAAAQAALPGGPARVVGGAWEDDTSAGNGWLAKVITPSGSCSATLINRDWILTGTYCFSNDAAANAGQNDRVAGPDDLVQAAGQTRRATWVAARGVGMSLARLDAPVDLPSYPALARQNPPIGARTFMYGAGTDCLLCAQVGRYRSAPLNLIQADYGDLWFRTELLSAAPAGTFTVGDFGGAQMYNGTLAGVLNGSGATQNNTAPTNVMSKSVADNRTWIVDTMKHNPVPGRLVIGNTHCLPIICG